jgi:hypothetical protein
VILGEQSATRTVKAEVVNASFVAGDDVTSVAFADRASAGMRGFVALTVKGKLPAARAFVLVIVSVDGCDVCAAAVNDTEAGTNDPVAPAGSPDVARLAVKFPVLLPRFTVTVYVAEWPAGSGEGVWAPTATDPTPPVTRSESVPTVLSLLAVVLVAVTEMLYALGAMVAGTETVSVALLEGSVPENASVEGLSVPLAGKPVAVSVTVNGVPPDPEPHPFFRLTITGNVALAALAPDPLAAIGVGFCGPTATVPTHGPSVNVTVAVRPDACPVAVSRIDTLSDMSSVE